jgi:hypothetical protein
MFWPPGAPAACPLTGLFRFYLKRAISNEQSKSYRPVRHFAPCSLLGGMEAAVTNINEVLPQAKSGGCRQSAAKLYCSGNFFSHHFSNNLGGHFIGVRKYLLTKYSKNGKIPILLQKDAHKGKFSLSRQPHYTLTTIRFVSTIQMNIFSFFWKNVTYSNLLWRLFHIYPSFNGSSE